MTTATETPIKPIQAFACRCKGHDHEETYNAATPGQAKQRYFYHVSDCYPDIQYTDIRVRRIGAPISGDDFRRVANRRGIPFAYVGMRVAVSGLAGRIVGHNDSANLDVLFDEGPRAGAVMNCHPHWQMTYFDDDGNIVGSFGG